MWATPYYGNDARQKLILAISAVLYFVQPFNLLRLILYGRQNRSGIVTAYIMSAIREKRNLRSDDSGVD